MADEGRAADQTRAGVGFVFGVLDAVAVPGPIVVQLLGEVGLAEASVRQQLARMLRQRHLQRERRGRVSVYRMTGGYLERWLRLRHGDRPPPWTGAYEVVVHDIPERHRRRRELLLAAAARAGFAPARSGLLIGVRAPDFATEFRTGGDPAAGEDLVEVGRLQLDLAAARRLADSAWHLEDRAAELALAAEELRGLLRSERSDPPVGTEALGRLWTGLGVSAAARFGAPALPVELLPAPWPGEQVEQLFARLVERYRGPVGDHLYAKLSASPYAELVVGGWWPEVSRPARPGSRPTEH